MTREVGSFAIDFNGSGMGLRRLNCKNTIPYDFIHI